MGRARAPVRGSARPGGRLIDRFATRPRLSALLGAVAISFSGIFYRYSGASPSTATVFRCLYALPFLALLGRSETRRFGRRTRHERRLALLAGVCFACDLLFWMQAVHQVGVGLATVLANLSVVVVGFAGWLFLGERPDRRVFLGLPLVIGGSILISGVLDRDAYGVNPVLGVALSLIAAVSYGSYLLIIRLGNRDGLHTFGSLFDASVSAAVVGAIAGLLIGDLELLPQWPMHAWLALIAITSQVIGYGLINVSLPRLPAVITSVLLLVQPVVTIAAAAVLLQERPSGLQLLGVGLILVGVVVAAGRRRAEPASIAALGTAA